jgi:hypothetical protein
LAHDGRIVGLPDLCWVHAEDVKPLEPPVRAAIAA